MAHQSEASWLFQRYWHEGASFSELANEAGVSVGTIANRFDLYGFQRRKPGPKRGPVHKGSLTLEQLEEIKEKAAQGVRKVELAEEYGVSRARIYQILKGDHRTH